VEAAVGVVKQARALSLMTAHGSAMPHFVTPTCGR
jgi:hypothetical protein